MKIPTQKENPHGFHARYFIEKINGHPKHKKAEYFVLRLDDYGSDRKHINACRMAIIEYANVIKPHFPKLAKDLKERYLKLL